MQNFNALGQPILREKKARQKKNEGKTPLKKEILFRAAYANVLTL
jgi:hypothetical protein